ncbi:VanW family protein, partial [bacterium]|nr:VanW family protein [bacterium]
DMKFVNDTDKHILIQTRIVGTKLYFDFWGTKDGRQVTVTDPIIYNIVGPGPTKEIETLDLEPGKRRCTESAHNGADAYFDYKVEYVDGEIFEERVRSHYVPWQAVCLVGVEKLSSDESEDESDESEKSEESAEDSEDNNQEE